MSGWCSLSGTLVHKSGGAFSRLRTRRKLWVMLDTKECRVVGYRSWEVARDHPGDPLLSLPLPGVGITVNPNERNQFIIMIEGKEHFFTAENHESMMVWLLGIQASRDAQMPKDEMGLPPEELGEDTGQNVDGNKKTLFLFDALLEEDTDLSDWDVVESNVALNKTSDMTQEALNEAPVLPKVRNTRSFTTSTIDLYRKEKGRKEFREEKLMKILGESMDGGLDLYKEQAQSFEDLKTWDSQAGGYQHHPRTEASLSSGISVGDHLTHCLPGDTMAGASFSENLTDDVFSADDNFTPCRSNASFIRKSFSESTNVNLGAVSSGISEIHHSSTSGRSGSTDSMLDRISENEVYSQLAELEQQLLSTKCEMATLLNRETCFRDVVNKRDSVILQLDEDLEELRKEKDRECQNKKMKEQIRELKNKNHFLIEEVKKLAGVRYQEHVKYTNKVKDLKQMDVVIDMWKRDYVALLQSMISVPTGDLVDGLEVNLFAETRHKERIKDLLDEARAINPSLPTYQSLSEKDVHVDGYGFRHTFKSEGLLLHYICQHLHRHYRRHRIQGEEHRRKWKDMLRNTWKPLVKTKELKSLCRDGIPSQHRKDVWRRLVYSQVADIREEKGPHYYNHLVNLAYDSQCAGLYRKQITLDLLRTMPNNINFNFKNAEGIRRMKEVLQAFTMHNPDVGYCQGLNFIVGMCLLFLNTEDTFWALVAITEKYFSVDYFDKNLCGAQADQMVFKDIIKVKLPDLYRHLHDLDIEVSTVTLNWFLAIFFDAVPFECLIRLWDCFLLEGPKVLFRVALAILKINEKGILLKKDTIGIIRHLKSCGMLMYDVDGLIQTAFEKMKPFPKRRDIVSKQVVYLNVIKEKIKKRDVARQSYEQSDDQYSETDQIPMTTKMYECVIECKPGLVWICYGIQNEGNLNEVNCQEELSKQLGLKVDSRIMCACCLESEILLVGTLSCGLHAFSIKNSHELWLTYLHDSILSMCCTVEGQRNRLYVGLADGSLAVLEQVQPKEPTDEPFYIPIGRSPVTSIVVCGTKLWIACGNAVYILCAETLDLTDKLEVTGNSLDHILCLCPSQYGVFTTVKGSSILELWDTHTLTCSMLYDIRISQTVPAKKDDEGKLNFSRITSIMVCEGTLWIGSGDGTIYIYDIISSPCSPVRNSTGKGRQSNRTTSTRQEDQVKNEGLRSKREDKPRRRHSQRTQNKGAARPRERLGDKIENSTYTRMNSPRIRLKKQKPVRNNREKSEESVQNEAVGEREGVQDPEVFRPILQEGVDGIEHTNVKDGHKNSLLHNESSSEDLSDCGQKIYHKTRLDRSLRRDSRSHKKATVTKKYRKSCGSLGQEQETSSSDSQGRSPGSARQRPRRATIASPPSDIPQVRCTSLGLSDDQEPQSPLLGTDRKCLDDYILEASPSHSTCSSGNFSDLAFPYELRLQVKIKIADKPVRVDDQTVIISCAGCQGDDEAILKWTKDPDEKLWTNEPILEVCPITNAPRRPSYTTAHSMIKTGLSKPDVVLTE